jgi:hypothetical protein
MKQFGRRHQIVKIPDPVPGHKIELRVVEHLTVNAGNLLNRLSVPGVLNRAEIKGRPFWEQRIRSSK